MFEEFAGGLDPEGAVAIETFVKRGGTLIAIDASCRFAIDLFEIPAADATRGDKAKDFSCPGSVLRVVPARTDSLYTVGLEESLACFFDGALVDLIPRLAIGELAQRKMLIDNPMRLYWPEEVR